MYHSLLLDVNFIKLIYNKWRPGIDNNVKSRESYCTTNWNWKRNKTRKIASRLEAWIWISGWSNSIGYKSAVDWSTIRLWWNPLKYQNRFRSGYWAKGRSWISSTYKFWYLQSLFSGWNWVPNRFSFSTEQTILDE